MNHLASYLKNSPSSPGVVIAGPCALESREQLRQSIGALQRMGLTMVRASLWKPRTQPGWDGLGWTGLQMLLEETLPIGMVPATEIMTIEHAQMVVKALRPFGGDANMILWLGARNQNHIEQRKIASLLASGPAGITLMFKNQMWEDEEHWFGIYKHIVEEGFPEERLVACHRGFAPGRGLNPYKLRNLPDFEMAMRIKERTGLSMILDPSHIGGSPDNVGMICQMALPYAFDGHLIEMHCTPHSAETDMRQQLTPTQLENLLPTLSKLPYTVNTAVPSTDPFLSLISTSLA